MPEKYRTFKADDPKALDVDATLRKVSDGYQALAKRLGTGDAPPAAHTEYKVAPPDALKDAFKADDPAFAGFLEQAHKAGFTQAQLDVAMAGFFATAPKLVAGAQQLDTDACVAELRKEWTEPAAYQQNMTAAMRALRAYGGDAQVDALVGRFGNDPVALKLLAAVGRDIREDRPPQGGSTSGAHEIEALMKSEAYTNPKHAEHAMVSAQVKAHFDRMAGTGAPLQ
ncbi:MAG: hypothetical protein BWZ09_02760 [Alphaproteobacteria bacterium ADurb.BinA305]|nr:MAG: hypothetical protein BWZ09_02760 [Alphaproteobacteria bacterium ADurb.BinA305]